MLRRGAQLRNQRPVVWIRLHMCPAPVSAIKASDFNRNRAIVRLWVLHGGLFSRHALCWRRGMARGAWFDPWMMGHGCQAEGWAKAIAKTRACFGC